MAGPLTSSPISSEFIKALISGVGGLAGDVSRSIRDSSVGGVVNSLNPGWFPTAGRTFVESMQGNKSPISEKNFTPEELDVIMRLIQETGSKKSGSVQYADYVKMAKADREYGDKPLPASIGPSSLSMADPFGNVQTTLGRFSYESDGNGGYKVKDTYDFNSTPNSSVEDAMSVSPYGLMRMYGGQVMPPGSGRDVSINLGKSPPVDEWSHWK